MNDDQAKIQQELTEIQTELNTTGMSRRKFLDRLKGVGLGFGAVAVVGTGAAQAHTGQALAGDVSLKTTNAALGKVVEDQQPQEAAEAGDEQNQQLAYHWGYRRRRHFYRYRRFIYRRRYIYRRRRYW